jgi:predicted MFS family arabinose efflux permease
MMVEFTRRQKLSLLLAHVAGMIDLVALPLWVGAALIGYYKFTPQQAGALATAYLLSVVFASLLISPRLRGFSPHRIVALAFSLASVQCVMLAHLHEFTPMLFLHIMIGLAVGTGLSATHGVIGRSANPHKLFAFVGTGLGIFAVTFMSSMAFLLSAIGGGALFYAFAATMALAGITAAFIFPRLEREMPATRRPAEGRMPVPPGVWWVVGGISLMVLTQATMASFFERIGVDHGFGDTVLMVLAASLPITIFPPVLAGFLQKKWPAQRVACCGPLVQAALAVVIVSSTGIAPYAIAVPLFVSSSIFTHTFSFGWLARLDSSGTVTALTPAMLMAGSAVGPVLGGVLVQQLGYWSLGIACVLISSLSAMCTFGAARAERKSFLAESATCAAGS